MYSHHIHTYLSYLPFTVPQTRPSALKQQGILVDDVEVKDETEEGYTLRFVTSNCMSGMPLLGIFDGAGDYSSPEVVTCKVV